MVSDGHRITITSSPRPYPASGMVFVATCSCGQYRSRNHSYISLAEKAARDHVMGKMGATFDLDDFYRQITHQITHLAPTSEEEGATQ